MVVGAFFSEVGNYLLRDLLSYFDNRLDISQHLNIGASWSKKDFKKAANFAYHLRIEVDCKNIDLARLKVFLAQKRTFLLTLLENPTLLEHDILRIYCGQLPTLTRSLKQDPPSEIYLNETWNISPMISAGYMTTWPANG